MKGLAKRGMWTAFAVLLTTSGLCTSVTGVARAQTADDAQRSASSIPPDSAPDASDPVAAERRRAEEAEARLLERIDQLQKQLDDRAAVEANREADEMAALFEEEPPDASSDRSWIHLNGFFDLALYKHFFDKESAYNGYVAPHLSFAVSNVNLFVGAQLTESLSTILELRFSFLPHGNENTFNTYAEGSDMLLASYERNDGRLGDPMTSDYLTSHGVTIERVHLTWAPRQWFQVLAGLFLTPYGIWNVEHGSPVYIPIHPPYMQIRAMVPINQLGLQIRGRLFPANGVYFEYVATVSNGRESLIPTNTVDYDDNKAIGLGLALGYESSVWSACVGGYGYLGTKTDIEKDAILSSGKMPVRVRIVDTEVLQEKILSAYAWVEASGLRVQGEFVWTRGDHDVHPELTQEEIIMLDLYAPGAATMTRANYIGYGAYGLIAYELPLHRFLDTVRISPFAMYEYNVSNDVISFSNLQHWSGGLNVKLSPFVTWKAEYIYLKPEMRVFGRDIQTVGTQIAVTF